MHSPLLYSYLPDCGLVSTPPPPTRHLGPCRGIRTVWRFAFLPYSRATCGLHMPGFCHLYRERGLYGCCALFKVRQCGITNFLQTPRVSRWRYIHRYFKFSMLLPFSRVLPVPCGPAMQHMQHMALHSHPATVLWVPWPVPPMPSQPYNFLQPSSSRPACMCQHSPAMPPVS